MLAPRANIAAQTARPEISPFLITISSSTFSRSGIRLDGYF